MKSGIDYSCQFSKINKFSSSIRLNALNVMQPLYITTNLFSIYLLIESQFMKKIFITETIDVFYLKINLRLFLQ